MKTVHIKMCARPPVGVSPSPTTLLDRYSSPPSGPTRRRLFVDPVDGDTGVTSTSSANTTPANVTKAGQASLVTAIPAGQTVVTMATATVTANNGQTVTIPVQGKVLKTRSSAMTNRGRWLELTLTSAGIANESGGITFFPVQVSVTGQGTAALQPVSTQTLTGTLAVQSPATKSAGSPLRKGSLSLFFRKVRVLHVHFLSLSYLHIVKSMFLWKETFPYLWRREILVEAVSQLQFPTAAQFLFRSASWSYSAVKSFWVPAESNSPVVWVHTTQPVAESNI